jgi:hypothetical protein
MSLIHLSNLVTVAYYLLAFIVFASLASINFYVCKKLADVNKGLIKESKILPFCYYLLVGGLIIGGIFALAGVYFKESPSKSLASIEEKRLNTLDYLYKNNLISLAEYETKRKSIIDRL